MHRIDTHGAVVFLAGAHAYKVKRAVRFPFLDYSTVDKRRSACEAEIVVNRSYAPQLYLGIIPITRETRGLVLGGDGEPVEWAVHMRRFDLAATLDRVAEAGDLSPPLLAKVTRAILVSHARAPRRDGAAAVAAFGRYIQENDAELRGSPDLFPAAAVGKLTQRAETALASTRALLLERGESGFVRRCHGDLHLRNLVLLDGEPTLFDAIEFDETIATVDILYDLGFLLMDMWQRNLRAGANLVLNRYLWKSEEANLSGLVALPLFLSFRAAIRAKVAAAGLAHLPEAERERATAAATQYFACAEEFLEPVSPRIIGVGGLSGTGKSTLAAALAPHLGRAPGAIHLRSDIERKRLFDVTEHDRLPAEAYQPEVGRKVYAQLLRKVSLAARSGASVIVDAVHAREEERSQIEVLAHKLGVPFTGLWLEARMPVLLERVTQRRRDASDADAAVVAQQAGYDVGRVNWPRVNAEGSLERAIQTARVILGIDGPVEQNGARQP